MFAFLFDFFYYYCTLRKMESKIYILFILLFVGKYDKQRLVGGRGGTDSSSMIDQSEKKNKRQISAFLFFIF